MYIRDAAVFLLPKRYSANIPNRLLYQGDPYKHPLAF